MPRFVLVLCLALVLTWAPAAGAQVRTDQQEESFSLARWLQPLRGALDWLVSRLPTFRSTSRNAGGMIDPGAVAAPAPAPGAVPEGKGIPPWRVGAMISPSG